MNNERYINPNRIYIASTELSIDGSVYEDELVYVKPPLETCLPLDRIKDLVAVGLYPKERWQTQTSPIITVFRARDAKGYDGNEAPNSREAALNLGSIILASMHPDSVDVKVIGGFDALKRIYEAELWLPRPSL